VALLRELDRVVPAGVDVRRRRRDLSRPEQPEQPEST
jgi:hypothetical protein